MSTHDKIDETTGLPVDGPIMFHDGPDPLWDPLEEARQPTRTDPETGEILEYNSETGEYDVSEKNIDWGVEGVDWEWVEGEEETEPDDEPVFDFSKLHSCRPKLPHTGYHQSIANCIEDRFGRLWLFDEPGRRGTQALFCPFCGFQALDSTAPEKPMQVVPSDVALTPKDKPTAVWKQHKERVMMFHFQFGSVRVLASDGCHAKVLTHDRVQLTVCVENMSEIKGEKVLPKVFAKKKTSGTGRKRGEVDPELMKKYLDMGLD